MKISTITLLLIFLLQLPALAADIDLLFRHGDPVQDRKTAWKGHIDFASWVDDEQIVFFSRGNVTCVSTKTGKAQWLVKDIGKISDWSMSRGTKRLAILGEDDTTYVIDCNNGKALFTADRKTMAKILGQRFFSPYRIAISPKDGSLVITNFSTFYSRNAFVLDASYKELASSFEIDASPLNLSLSPTGQRVAIIADENVLCLRDLAKNRDVFFRGKRIKEKQKSSGGAIDVPFFSHFRDSGGDEIVYTQDNSWSTGKVFVHNLTTKTTHSFDGRNGHIELDVSFQTRRIALTGTSTDFTILDFDGNVIVHKKNATLQRNVLVEFSPSADKILVASWDNTLSVFSIPNNGK